MKVITLDSCNFTKLAIVNLISTLGLSNFHIFQALNTEQFLMYYKKKTPDLVFISDEFIFDGSVFKSCLKNIVINNHRSVFIIFTSSSSRHFKDFLKLRDNIVIISKAIDLTSLRDMIQRKAKRFSLSEGFYLNSKDNLPITLSFTESAMLEMWMSGVGTVKISQTLGIKEKTVSSHKFNVKVKMKTNSQLAIFHIVKLVDTLTHGFFVSMK